MSTRQTKRLMSICWGCLFSVVSLGMPISALGNSDWIQFRGNDGQGVSLESDPPVEWSSEKNTQWRVSMPGKGWSSPVIKEGRLYLTSAVHQGDGDGGSLQLLCFDVESGRQLWVRDVFSLPEQGIKHDKNTHASATPYIGEGRIYAHFGHFGTVCVDTDGEIVWKQESLPYEPVHGNGGSPVIVGKNLIFSSDGKKDPVITALDLKTGAVVWRQKRETDATRKFSFSTPLLVSVSGKEQVVSAASGAVFGYAPTDGRELWRVDYGQGYSVVPRPIVGHGHVYVATGFGRPNVLAIRLGGDGNVTDSHITWQTSRSGPKTPSMLLDGNLLYYVSDGGIVSCVKAVSGDPVWQDRVKGNVSSSPIIAGNRIYIGTEEGIVYVLKTGSEFQQLAANDFGERIFASPAITGDALIVRTETYLYRIESK
ncbi:PQQ-binding-like beta-propeller repeat protein [Verrucomicrobia bacterium]|nr:PQQ-binding-like beta-propeller repeat protein [Verrucomicrobiota bacterium]